MYVSFDLEIAKSIPNGTPDWNALRPFGITCAATLVSSGEDLVWRPEKPKLETDRYADQMTPGEVESLVNYLAELSANDCPPLSWNGASFDMRCLADEAPDKFPEIVALTLDQIDPGFQMMREIGTMCGLQAAAEGMGVEGKLKSVGGARAPEMWRMDRGNQELVLDYVLQDVRATENVYEAILDKGYLAWSTRSGNRRLWNPTFKECNEGRRLLTVAECLGMPEHNRTWKTEKEMIGWLKE